MIFSCSEVRVRKHLGACVAKQITHHPQFSNRVSPWESMLHDVCEFLDDPTLGHDGHFLSATELQEKKIAKMLWCSKTTPIYSLQIVV